MLSEVVGSLEQVEPIIVRNDAGQRVHIARNEQAVFRPFLGQRISVILVAGLPAVVTPISEDEKQTELWGPTFTPTAIRYRRKTGL